MLKKNSVGVLILWLYAATAAPVYAIDFLAPTSLAMGLEASRMGVITEGFTDANFQACPGGYREGWHMIFVQKGQPPIIVDILKQINEPVVGGGTRIKNVVLVDPAMCVVGDVTYGLFTASIIEPGGTGVVFFETEPDVILDDGHTGVVTGNEAEDGSYQIVFRKSAGPASKVWIYSVDYLEAGDRWTDIVLISSDTYGTLYAAFVDY